MTVWMRWTFGEVGKTGGSARVQQGMTPRHFAILLASYLAFLGLVDVSAYLGIIPTKIHAIPLYDTIGHFVLLGLAGFLLHRTLGRRVKRFAGIPVPVGPALVVLGAACEELLQVLSPIREACFSDFAADVAGIALFCGIDAVYRAYCLRQQRA